LLFDNEGSLRHHASCMLDISGVEEHLALQWAMAAVWTLWIASPTPLEIFGFWSVEGGVLPIEYHPSVLWGTPLTSSDDLPEEAVRFAKRHATVVESLLLPDEYSRVANAIRLYSEALNVRNADLALLGFVGAMESLFSIEPQELSFRLSLLLAKFLGENLEQQRLFFARARKLYATRSKIAHGDKLTANEEAAAIQTVEHWTPEAEELVRLGIKRLLDKSLVNVFNSKKRHETLLTELLFSATLDDAINAVS
jgi:hypothetical protein